MDAQTPALAAQTGRHRVAVLINDMHAAGGIQRVAANLVRDLGRHYDATLLSVEPLDNAVFHEPGLDFQSLNLRRPRVSRVRRLLDFAQGGRELRRWVAKHDVDTVLAIWYDWASVAALALPARVKTIGCEHIAFGEATPKMRLLRRITYPRLDAVVSLTNEDLPRLAALSRSAHVIPNYLGAVQPGPFEGRDKILLTIGHLNARKGLDRLLWALKQPLLQHPDWTLVVVGGGEKGHVDWGYMDYVAVLLKVLRLEGRVEFHAATTRIDPWYRRAALYVMGSRQEGLPMVLIEAKAHGLPVVAFDCPTGPKEIIRHGVDGFLIPPDSQAFGDAAAALMADPELRRRMGDAAVQDCRQRFSAEGILPRWRALIDGLHQSPASPTA